MACPRRSLLRIAYAKLKGVLSNPPQDGIKVSSILEKESFEKGVKSLEEAHAKEMAPPPPRVPQRRDSDATRETEKVLVDEAPDEGDAEPVDSIQFPYQWLGVVG